MKHNLLKSVIISVILLMGVSNAWAANINGGTTLYLKPNANWNTQDNGKTPRFAAYFCNGTSSAKWYSMSDCNGDGVYEVTVDEGESHTNVIFCRMTPHNSTNDWAQRWNQSSDLTWDGSKDLYTVKEGTWDTGGGTWSSKSVTWDLAGGMNNWNNTANKFSGSPLSVSVTLTANTTYEFKLHNTEGCWWGNTGTMDRNNCSGWTMTHGSDNCKIKTDVGGTYKFSFDASTKKLTVTYPAAYTVTYGVGTTKGTTSVTTNPSITSGSLVLASTSITFSKGTTKTGYQWKNWNTNANGTGTNLETNATYTSSNRNANTTVYACYDLITYNITYNLNGGTGATNTTYNVESAAITLPTAPTKTGYTFAGWYDNANLTGNKVTQVAKGSTGNKTFYAKWNANKYTITWNANGGSVTPASSTYTYDGEPVTLPTPTRTGYTFNGWFTASSGGTRISDVGKTNKPASNTTYYAQWTENKYTVNIVANPAEAAKTLTSGPKQVGINAVSIATTTNIGYQFVNWTATAGITIANSNNASTTITATKAGTVTANFEAKFTTIYLEPTGYWNSHNPQYVAHVWNGSGDEKDIIMTGVGKAPYKYYEAKVPYGYTNVVFFRKKSDGSELWNQTADLAIPTDTKTLYEILSTGEGTSTKATGKWKEANLVYTITLGSSMFGPYGISYNGQSYFSKDDADVVINLPYGATINFIEGQPYSDIYTGGIMEEGKVRQFDLTQPYTIERDIRFDANYVTKVPQVAYLGVPNSLSGWAETDTRAQYIWRFDAQGEFNMEEVADRGTFEFEVDGVKYYKYTIKAGCNKFQFQHKTKSDSEYNQKTTHYKTHSHLYEVLTTDVNCYMLDGTFSGTIYDGYWCALPAREGDYRLLYVEQVVEKDADGYTIITRKKAHPSDIIRKGTDSRIVSLHTYKERTYTANAGGGLTYESSNNPEIILQKYIGNNQWQDVECQMVYGPLETLPIMANLPGRKNASSNSNIDDLQHQDGIEKIKNDTHEDQGNGVWNFVVKQVDGKASVQWDETHRYTGEYYIRTNAAFGAWNSYKGSDNHMTRSDVSKRNSNYSHYYCKWIDQVGTNVTYTIANDYGMAISDTLTADSTTLWGDLLANADKMVTGETLPASANVRFSWNEKSNFLHRAYLAGSTDVASRFLVLEGKSDQLYDAEGQALALGANGSDRYGLKANEEIFNDISNWVYYTDVQMIPGAELKLTAKYNNKVQYFIGQADQYNNTILKGEGDDKYLIRLLYDFKTNELISAYVPGGQEGKEIEAIETNLMLLRKENEAPRQLSFNANNMKDVGKQAYGVLELTKATLIDNTQGKNIYARSLYWISFPFDVRITDIFGFGEYGKHWLIQSYDGAKRAREGLWADSETNWVYHFDPNTLNAGTPDAGIMKKGVGYVVALNLKNIQAESPFVGRITTIALYFPSTTTITGHIVNENAVSISVPKHECTIIRPTPDGDRHIKDSHWNVIGVPSYINAVGDFTGKINTIAEDVKFYYRWLGDYDEYEVVSGKSGVPFNSLNAYMVQFAGNLQWTNVLNEEAPAGMAAKRNSDNMQEHHLCLELQQNGNEQDRTFIQLQEDEVTTAFDFNYDLCKIINKGANIYSLIATDRDPIEVAGNVLPVEEAIIPLGIKTDAAGEYTFAMPDGTDGIVVELIDYETNTRTNMLLDEYTVKLGKGTFENRFALHVQPSKVTTSVEDINTNSNGVKKYLIDGILYMQKDGVLYDAQGKLVR